MKISTGQVQEPLWVDAKIKIFHTLEIKIALHMDTLHLQPNPILDAAVREEFMTAELGSAVVKWLLLQHIVC